MWGSIGSGFAITGRLPQAWLLPHWTTLTMSAVSTVAVASHTVARTVSVIATRRWSHDICMCATNWIFHCCRPWSVMLCMVVNSPAMSTIQWKFSSQRCSLTHGLPVQKIGNCKSWWWPTSAELVKMCMSSCSKFECQVVFLCLILDCKMSCQVVFLWFDFVLDSCLSWVMIST